MLWPVYLFILVLAKRATMPPLAERTEPPRPGPAASFVSSTPNPSAAPPTGPAFPQQMTMFSVYAGPEHEDQQRTLTLHCRLDRAVSNLEPRSMIRGSLGEDVIGTGGKVLIPSGAIVVGQAFCDPERARLLGRGRWTVFMNDRQISAQGILLDSYHKEGLAGTECSERINPIKTKAAIYRDGIFLYVPAVTGFLIRLWGDVAVQELTAAPEDSNARKDFDPGPPSTGSPEPGATGTASGLFPAGGERR